MEEAAAEAVAAQEAVTAVHVPAEDTEWEVAAVAAEQEAADLAAVRVEDQDEPEDREHRQDTTEDRECRHQDIMGDRECRHHQDHVEDIMVEVIAEDMQAVCLP